MCLALIGKVEIVGWKELGLEQGTTHTMMSMEEFTDARVNLQQHSRGPTFLPQFQP
ncbi:hypothetical protein BGZ95_003579, partial [Linnemannia exigua]